MFAKSLLLTLALAATTLATGQSIIKNKCGFPVWITSVDHEPHPTISLAAGGTWSEPQRYDPATGISIKIGTYEGALYTGGPIIQFAYTAYPPPYIYYDISTSYGYDPKFIGEIIDLSGSATGAPEIVWNGGPESNQNTKAYAGDTDLILTLCA
ncbi:hypothetical protein K505DRAFT_288623 [Melanomma pulvis-pyrius CBS 109.77]|uniref:BYS1 domain protein n=1 Tax=Melanomma pulvis-pyrius CBS 109.77 TaxID=1314802 RepID=A0A6A6WSZ9_9PLEO|nr:hypothetical protein K505DRAFT_288623 [Melanomma pulvis-pyrius CBS 109.77]